ncbi:MAG: MOSC domain-containing protein [Pseudomonadota bacterium]
MSLVDEPGLSDRGRVIGIARRDVRKAPMEVLAAGTISLEAGLEGDHKGLKYKNRALTMLALEDWQLALSEVAERSVAAGATRSGSAHTSLEAGAGQGTPSIVALDWTARRANLLVEGVDLPKAPGGRMTIGDSVELEVTYPCQPCRRMDDALPGLLKALHPDWRGGVVMKVLSGGEIAIGDVVRVTARPVLRKRHLP